uniref:NADH-ubiquinone oxidoreductase chain 4 n=1 Tax=Conwentzia sinica TaxID=450904 RepID=A0A7U1AQB3_9NEOP|nr:NADH dehydrogenase subunit 4 [Conwentzia sinica]QQY84956.1 NADH dehydrogenase subunit 4 [Conwentzia sinica]
MLKYLFMMLFMMLMILKKKTYWNLMFWMFILFFLFMLKLNFNLMFMNISYFMGCDLLSFGLILLSIWICCLMLMASEVIFNNNNNLMFFKFNLMFLLLMLYLSFSSMSVFYFYVFFEMSLIPTLFLILGWGYQPERIQAGFYLLFYTLFASLPLLICIFYLYFHTNILSWDLIMYMDFTFTNYLYLGFIFAFLVKMPMFLVHLWLPKAHVEAPISGSMILAAIMLKLGGYGLLRTLFLMSKVNNYFNWVVVLISLVGGLILSILCLRQIDIKSLIAYSSVVHMSMILGGLFSLNYLGYVGSYCLMISHGLCSSGLFCLANIIYERSSSRNLFLNKGLINLMPSLSLWWFLLISSNMSAPPSLNLLGEIVLMMSILSMSTLWWVILMLLSFFSVCYSLYLYTYSQHGKLFSGIYSFFNIQVREYLLLLLHWLPLNFIILKSEMVLFWL